MSNSTLEWGFPFWGIFHIENIHFWRYFIDFTVRNEQRHEKTNILVSDLVLHKPGCTATEDGQRLEILDLNRRGSVLSM